jgi:2,3-bisphosphoglycerate-independent phosphoglycerate mutase
MGWIETGGEAAAAGAHSHGAVPFVIAGTGVAPRGQRSYDEAVADASELSFKRGHELMRFFLG